MMLVVVATGADSGCASIARRAPLTSNRGRRGEGVGSGVAAGAGDGSDDTSGLAMGVAVGEASTTGAPADDGWTTGAPVDGALAPGSASGSAAKTADGSIATTSATNRSATMRRTCPNPSSPPTGDSPPRATHSTDGSRARGSYPSRPVRGSPRFVRAARLRPDPMSHRLGRIQLGGHLI